MRKFGLFVLVIAGAFLCMRRFAIPYQMGSPRSGSLPRPILNHTTVPPWFETGKYRAARWDGGPIEAEKGVLSRYFPADDPRLLEAERNWYDPITIRFLKAAHINWAWVTWSNGFSPETEHKQWRLLRRYIALCHKNNIRVTAYISIGNMFWKDMFEHLPASIAWVERLPDGSPRFYSRPYRYMADISNQDWIALQEDRVKAAAEAGADAFWIDNTFGYEGIAKVSRFIDAMYAVASKINPHMVIMSNYNRGIYTWARLQNGVTTEDGQEPGYYTDQPSRPVLVTNAGLLRYNYGIGEGWRPVSIEDGGRHSGDREGTLLEPRKWQLEIAEAAMYHVGLEMFVEGAFARGLYWGQPPALEDLHEIGAYNAFLQQHEQYYTHPKSLARVAVLCDTTDSTVPYLNDLSAQHLNYNVIFNYQSPRPAALRRYRVIILPSTNPLSRAWCDVLSQWVRHAGGTLIATGDASLFAPGRADAHQDFGLGPLLGISKQQIPETMIENQRGQGHAIYLPRLPAAHEMVALVHRYLGNAELIEVEPRQAILFNASYQAQERRIVLHLLNYRQDLQRNIHITARVPVDRVEILSPDALSDKTPAIRVQGKNSEILVPELQTYDLVVIYPHKDLSSAYVLH